MDTSTSAYRLMELIAISGECSPRVLAHLHLSGSYGEKLITRLKKEGHIRTHYKKTLPASPFTSPAAPTPTVPAATSQGGSDSSRHPLPMPCSGAPA